MRRLGLSLALVALFCPRALTPSPDARPFARKSLLEGHRLYYEGLLDDALVAYQKAVRADPDLAEAWQNGALLWAEVGKDELAVHWFRKAALLSPKDPALWTALGEAELRTGDLGAAREELRRALAVSPTDPWALVALGRVEMDLNPADAADAFAKAAANATDFSLAYYWLGKTREALGDSAGAAEAYKKAATGDSYFALARWHMDRTLHRLKLRAEAPAPQRPAEGLKGSFRQWPNAKRPPFMPSYPKGKIPVLRVGIGTTNFGNPLPRRSIRFSCKTRFDLRDAGERQLLTGPANEFWEIRVNKGRLEARAAGGKLRLRTKKALRIHPLAKAPGVTTLREADAKNGSADKPLRGEIEVSFNGRRGLKIVNLVDLESYTQGVLAAEMPITSPMEALKAQAVVARTHALYIKSVSRRHAKDGYDLCDGQHCQVYSGVRIENDRSRAVVDSTQGRVLAYQGRLALVLYSSNCGGHTQSGKDIPGWGDIPYWMGVADAAPSIQAPSTPWELRLWLRSVPPAYCRPSAYVHPSHYRWARVVPAEELERIINRSTRIGKLLEIRTLRRSSSGHLNSILVRGSLGSRLISQELRIRSRLGIGSQRSTLFVLETERDREGKPVDFIFYGGGWGHGVGMCQSGAMGRAEEGFSFAEILKAYYPGTELGNLRY